MTMEVVSHNVAFEKCFECHGLIEPLGALKLQNCNDCICKPCLRNLILKNIGATRIKCSRNGCGSAVLLWEIKAVLPKTDYLTYLEASGRLNKPMAFARMANLQMSTSNCSQSTNTSKDTVQSSSESRAGRFSPHFADHIWDIPRTANPVDLKTVQRSGTSHYIVKEKSRRFDNAKLLETLDIAFSEESCDCGFCGVKLNFGKGILLQACLHVFCKECLQEAVVGSSGGSVPCPNACGQHLYEREIKALVSQDQYERYSRKQMLAATKDLPIFQCKTQGCDGVCIPENDAKIFLCDICNRQNCLSCQTIHDGIPCDRWKRIRMEADRSGHLITDEELLKKSEDFGYKQISRTAQELLQGFPDSDLALYYDAVANVFEKAVVVPTFDNFECLICTNMTSEEETGGGFLLQQCGHAFCRSCLQHLVSMADEIPVPCPYDGEGGRCKEFLSPSEFKALASEAVFEKHIRWGWSIAEDILQKKFRCLERTCQGFWEFEDNIPIGIYICPVCQSENCVNCNAIHVAETCAELQEKLRKEAELIKDEENRRIQKQNEQVSESEVNKLINDKKYMRCPFCGFVCEKISGCAHVVCLNRICKQKFNWYN